MNRAERRAAAAGGFISVVLGEPDPDCEHCRSLGLAGTDRPQAKRGRTAPAHPIDDSGRGTHQAHKQPEG